MDISDEVYSSFTTKFAFPFFGFWGIVLIFRFFEKQVLLNVVFKVKTLDMLTLYSPHCRVPLFLVILQAMYNINYFLLKKIFDFSYGDQTESLEGVDCSWNQLPRYDIFSGVEGFEMGEVLDYADDTGVTTFLDFCPFLVEFKLLCYHFAVDGFGNVNWLIPP